MRSIPSKFTHPRLSTWNCLHPLQHWVKESFVTFSPNHQLHRKLVLWYTGNKRLTLLPPYQNGTQRFLYLLNTSDAKHTGNPCISYCTTGIIPRWNCPQYSQTNLLSAGDNPELQDLLPRFGGAALQFINFQHKKSYLLPLLLVFLFHWIQN